MQMSLLRNQSIGVLRLRLPMVEMISVSSNRLRWQAVPDFDLPSNIGTVNCTTSSWIKAARSQILTLPSTHPNC
jgi:hypothetical protein